VKRGMEESKDSSPQVRLQLTTRDQTVKLPDEIGSILVSTSLRRYALSTLVNNLLETEQPIPFEFLINGRFLRTSIDEFLTANGISSEVTLSLEYLRASAPPTHIASFEHDDWVASVDVLSAASPAALWAGKGSPVAPGNARILSGGYDGLLRVWSSSSQLLAVSAATADGPIPQAIKAAKFLSPTKIVTGGNDRIVRVWRYQEPDNISESFESLAKLVPMMDLFGHESSVESLAVHAPSSRILSASSDHTVGIWSSHASDAPSPPHALLPITPSNKRRKIGLSSAPKASIPQRGSLSILKGHSGPVSDVIFDANDRTVGYSSSWDHSAITWDLTTGIAVSTRRTLHPIFCVAQLPDLGLLAAGTSARHIAMVDLRADAKDVTGLTLRGHTGPVVSVAAEPDKPWGLVSASLDGTCRIWDLRSIRVDTTASMRLAVGGSGQVCESVYVIRREAAIAGEGDKTLNLGDGFKVFSVCWDKEIGIVSAGEDKRVQVNKSISPEQG
jgi:ribosome biogenesis protein